MSYHPMFLKLIEKVQFGDRKPGESFLGLRVGRDLAAVEPKGTFWGEGSVLKQ